MVAELLVAFFLSFFLFNCGRKRVSVLVTVVLYVCFCFQDFVIDEETKSYQF